MALYHPEEPFVLVLAGAINFRMPHKLFHRLKKLQRPIQGTRFHKRVAQRILYNLLTESFIVKLIVSYHVAQGGLNSNMSGD